MFVRVLPPFSGAFHVENWAYSPVLLGPNFDPSKETSATVLGKRESNVLLRITCAIEVVIYLTMRLILMTFLQVLHMQVILTQRIDC